MVGPNARRATGEYQVVKAARNAGRGEDLLVITSNLLSDYVASTRWLLSYLTDTGTANMDNVQVANQVRRGLSSALSRL